MFAPGGIVHINGNEVPFSELVIRDEAFSISEHVWDKVPRGDEKSPTIKIDMDTSSFDHTGMQNLMAKMLKQQLDDGALDLLKEFYPDLELEDIKNPTEELELSIKLGVIPGPKGDYVWNPEYNHEEFKRALSCSVEELPLYTNTIYAPVMVQRLKEL